MSWNSRLDFPDYVRKRHADWPRSVLVCTRAPHDRCGPDVPDRPHGRCCQRVTVGERGGIVWSRAQ